MRGSSCEASATTSFQPGSATTAPRTCFGSWRAPPPPLLAQRPVTTPPTTYSGRNRPSCTFASSQCQPFALRRRASFLYSSSGLIAGWSTSSSSHLLVDETMIPAPRSAFRRAAGESGLSWGAPSSRLISARTASIAAGRAPVAGRGPRVSVRSRSWTSARHGNPAKFISAATNAPADSAASSRRMLGIVASCCLANSATGSRVTPSSSENRPSGAASACIGWSQASGAARARVESAVSAELRRIARHRRRSTQRSTRTPAWRSGGYQRVVSSQTQRGCCDSSRATAAGRAARATVCRSPGPSIGVIVTYSSRSEERAMCTRTVLRSSALVEERAVLRQHVLLACLYRNLETVLLRRHRAVERVGEPAGREYRLVEVEGDVACGIRCDEKKAPDTVRGVATRRVGEDDLQCPPRLDRGKGVFDAVLAEGNHARKIEFASIALVLDVLEGHRRARGLGEGGVHHPVGVVVEGVDAPKVLNGFGIAIPHPERILTALPGDHETGDEVPEYDIARSIRVFAPNDDRAVHQFAVDHDVVAGSRGDAEPGLPLRQRSPRTRHAPDGLLGVHPLRRGEGEAALRLRHHEVASFTEHRETFLWAGFGRRRLGHTSILVEVTDTNLRRHGDCSRCAEKRRTKQKSRPPHRVGADQSFTRHPSGCQV